VPDRPRIA